jgi:hypothetical protein
MFVSKDIFDHELHIKLKDGNQGCKECHTDNSLAKNRSTAKPCTECHETMVQPNSLVKINKSWQGIAAGYMDAQHGLCLDCHEKIEKKRGQKFRTGMSGCRACHKDAVIQKERTKEIAKSVSKQQVNQ